MAYQPRPIDTTHVALPSDVQQLTEKLAEHAHDVWARGRLAQGWTYGPRRDDAQKQHPCLVPYAKLPESEQVHDRDAAVQTLKAIVALGYRITRA
jgi:ryanodine receptor 2